MKKTFEEFLKEKGHESVEGLDAEKLAGLYNEFNEAKRLELEKAIEAKASKEDISEMKKSLEAGQREQLKNLNGALKEMGLAIKRLTPAEKEVSDLSFGQQIRKGLEDNKDALLAMKERKVGAIPFSFETKVVGTMTGAGNVSGGNVPVEDRLEGFNIIPSRRIRLLDVMAQRATESNVVSWVYQAVKEGTTGQTAEGATKNQIDFDLVVDSEAVVKTTDFIKVSTEMLDDITFIESEINQELMRELMKVVEAQAYEGDGTGTNHNGIRTVASAFAAGTFALAVDNANKIDVLVVAANQIAVAQEDSAQANFIFMHPDDVTGLKLEKITSSDKRYVERLLQVGSTLVMDGIPIIPTTLVTVDEYLIGDFAHALLVTRQAMKFEVGLDGNDFTKNVVTIRGEWRGLTIVKNNDRSAFVAGDFSTDAAALETA